MIPAVHMLHIDRVLSGADNRLRQYSSGSSIRVAIGIEDSILLRRESLSAKISHPARFKVTVKWLTCLFESVDADAQIYPPLSGQI